METRRLKHRTKPWMNSHIIELIYKRDYLKRKAIKYKNEETWLLYKSARNYVTEMIKCSKRQHYENSIQESRHNYSKMYVESVKAIMGMGMGIIESRHQILPLLIY